MSLESNVSDHGWQHVEEVDISLPLDVVYPTPTLIDLADVDNYVKDDTQKADSAVVPKDVLLAAFRC